MFMIPDIAAGNSRPTSERERERKRKREREREKTIEDMTLIPITLPDLQQRTNLTVQIMPRHTAGNYTIYLSTS